MSQTFHGIGPFFASLHGPFSASLHGPFSASDNLNLHPKTGLPVYLPYEDVKEVFELKSLGERFTISKQTLGGRTRGQHGRFSNLPIELLKEIFSYLTSNDQICLALTCKLLGSVASITDLNETQPFLFRKSTREVIPYGTRYLTKPPEGWFGTWQAPYEDALPLRKQTAKISLMNRLRSWTPDTLRLCLASNKFQSLDKEYWLSQGCDVGRWLRKRDMSSGRVGMHRAGLCPGCANRKRVKRPRKITSKVVG